MGKLVGLPEASICISSLSWTAGLQVHRMPLNALRVVHHLIFIGLRCILQIVIVEFVEVLSTLVVGEALLFLR
jgi:hypothetical protein